MELFDFNKIPSKYHIGVLKAVSIERRPFLLKLYLVARDDLIYNHLIEGTVEKGFNLTDLGVKFLEDYRHLLE